MQIESIGMLKHTVDVTADTNQSMFVLTILEKINKARLKFPRGSVSVLGIYEEANDKLTNNQLKHVSIGQII